MENLTSQLTRTCNVCGIEKPLSAFLQLNSGQGASYGKICAKCRGMGKVVTPTPTATDEERSTTPSGSGIRGKEKLYADLKREQKIHTLKELYTKENIKKQDTLDEKTERVNLKETSEKKHREFYIDIKKQLDLLSKKVDTTQRIITSQRDQKITSIRNVAEQHQATLQTKKQEDAQVIKTIAEETVKKTSTNFNNLFHAIEPGRIEMQGEIRRFFTWLGNSAPIVQTLTQGTNSANANKARRELATESNPNTSEPTRRQRG